MGPQMDLSQGSQLCGHRNRHHRHRYVCSIRQNLQLLQLLTNLVTEDEKRKIQFLLSDTTLNVKISGANTEEPFLTNIGTPQGDSLSPVLFIIYLEQALKNVRSTLDSPSNTTEAHLPNEIVYADDIDFIGNQPANVKNRRYTQSSQTQSQCRQNGVHLSKKTFRGMENIKESGFTAWQ